MDQRGEGADFLNEAAWPNDVSQLAIQDLDRDATIVFPVLGEINLSHPAGSETFLDGVSVA
jgi:hypothetical protein